MNNICVQSKKYIIIEAQTFEKKRLIYNFSVQLWRGVCFTSDDISVHIQTVTLGGCIISWHKKAPTDCFPPQACLSLFLNSCSPFSPFHLLKHSSIFYLLLPAHVCCSPYILKTPQSSPSSQSLVHSSALLLCCQGSLCVDGGGPAMCWDGCRMCNVSIWDGAQWLLFKCDSGIDIVCVNSAWCLVLYTVKIIVTVDFWCICVITL